MALDSLSLYGSSFQIKAITCLLSSQDFLCQIYDLLSVDYFDSDVNHYIVGVILDHFKEYRTAPTLDVFRVKLASCKDDVLKKLVVDQITSISNQEKSTDLKYVRDEFLNFCKNQKFKKAILTSVDLLKGGRYEEIKSLIDDAMKAGSDRDYGLEYADTVDSRLSKNPRENVTATEWPVINEIIDGGLGAGDLGILVGNTGSGKSWSLVSIGLSALIQGKNVLHYTLELNENYTAMRYDSRLTGISSQNLKYHSDEVKQKIADNIKGRLIIKFFPTKTVSITSLKAHVDSLVILGFKPDLIILDYLDLLKSENKFDQEHGSYFEIGTIVEDTRGMAGELKVPLWSCSQAHRGAEEDDVILGSKVAESYKKIMTADFVASLSRKMEDKLANTARWYIIKNRYGPDGLTFPSKMDTSIGKIEIFAPTSVNGKEARKDMRNSNELLRKDLATKYADYVGFEEGEKQ